MARVEIPEPEWFIASEAITFDQEASTFRYEAVRRNIWPAAMVLMLIAIAGITLFMAYRERDEIWNFPLD